MANVLVTDLKVVDSPQAGIGVARCLNDMGHNVYGADDTPLVTTSDIFKETFVLEEIRTLNLDSLLNRLVDIKNKHNIEYIIPCYDETSILLSFIRDKLDFIGINLIAPDFESIKLIRKSNLENIVHGVNNVSVPNYKVVNTLKEALYYSKKIKYPVYVKGLTKAALRAENPQELESQINKISNIWNGGIINCIIQKEIKGKYKNVLLALKSNKIVAYQEMEKIAIDSNGATWFGKLISNTDLMLITEKICSKIKNSHACIIELEFIESSNGIFLYEINPIPPAWIYASALNGLNFPSILLFDKISKIGKCANEVFFGRETIDFLNKQMPQNYTNENLYYYNKGVAYKNSNTKYPSEILF